MKRLTNYNRTTLNNLQRILMSGQKDNSASILLRKVAPVIIPWGSRDKIMSEEELNTRIDDYIVSCFGGYEGSTQGYSSYRENMWTVLALRYGIRTADNLCLSVMDYHKCSIVNGHVVLEGVKCTKHYTYYTDRMLQFVNAIDSPELQKLSDDDKMEVALPVILDQGELAISLPVMDNPTDEEKVSLRESIRTCLRRLVKQEGLSKLDASDGAVSLDDLRRA